MTTLEQINALLPPGEQNRVLVSGALAALARYSCLSTVYGNHYELRPKERSGEISLMDRLWDCAPEDGCSWLRDELWDVRESLFEMAWGDTGEEWLAAIIGPAELDEGNAVALEGGIEQTYEIGEHIPAWSERKVPALGDLANFIKDWRQNLLRRLARQIPLESSESALSNGPNLCPKKKVGILAFGSLINDPGKELLPKIITRIKTPTPFGVEYGRYSQTRGGAPTLVPHKDGAPVDGEILVLDDAVSVGEARNMLWRRERRIEGSGKTYEEGTGANNVLVREWTDSPCVEHVFYTDFHPAGKVTNPQAAELATKAIQSVKAAKPAMDGITYLKNNLASGIKTKLTADYEAEILKQTKTSSLGEALKSAKAVEEKTAV